MFCLDYIPKQLKFIKFITIIIIHFGFFFFFLIRDEPQVGHPVIVYLYIIHLRPYKVIFFGDGGGTCPRCTQPSLGSALGGCGVLMNF